ncbi:hypothetical protein GALMADRAFT_251364, partial [Galerina marginata CBS 339.88]
MGKKYNALLSISTLPLELLLKVFRCDVTPRMDFGDPSRHLRRISQVCHNWRKAALGTPYLWSQLIECQSIPPKWFRVVLRRARSSPLRVTVLPPQDMASEPTVTNVQLALRELGNIGELEILGSVNKWITRAMIKHLQQQPAPSLKRLTFTVDGDHPYDLDSSHIEVQLLPANIFCGVAGPLQHLTLSSCLIDLRSPLYHHLTSLSMTDIPKAAAPSVSHFLDALRNMPDLTSLSLTSVLLASAPERHVEDVHLPRLSNLKINEHTAQCSQLLPRLRYPAIRRFDLHLQAFDRTRQTNLSDLIKQPLSGVEPFPFCTMLRDFYIGFSTRPQELRLDVDSDFFSVSWAVNPSVSSYTEALNILSSFVDDVAPRGSHCEMLTLDFCSDMSNLPECIIYNDFARPFSPVTILDVKGTNLRMDRFFDYLSTPNSGSMRPNSATSDSTSDSDACDSFCTAPTPTMQLPNLQHLFLDSKNASPSLIRFLEHRKECGYAIEYVHFTCLSDQSMLDTVKALCSSVTVDAPSSPVREEPREYFDYEGEEDIDSELDYLVE